METMTSTVLLSEQQVRLSSGDSWKETDVSFPGFAVLRFRENREKRQMGVKFLQPGGLHWKHLWHLTLKTDTKDIA